jgi:chlorobactene glucosyltransferase
MSWHSIEDLIYQLIVFQAVVLVILLSNIWISRRALRHPLPAELPAVSILIPARNEERGIRDCVQSLLAQDYPNFEVLVLDDQSSDGTLAVLEAIAAGEPRLSVLRGKPPAGRPVGKNWACSQLAREAGGELLLFTDADTRHKPDMLRSAVSALAGEQADLLTGFPRQAALSWGERLLVPFFSWAMYCFVPLAIAYRLKPPALSSAVGQLMLFRRAAYQAVGGHESVSGSLVEDLDLVKRIQAAGLRWRAAHVANLISCRMYRSGREAVDGFTKNLFAVFGYRLLPYGFAFTWLVVVFWLPVVFLAARLAGWADPQHTGAALVCVLLSFTLWLIHFLNNGIPAWLALLHPLVILANAAVAVRSCLHSVRGEVTWKGRPVARARWKWL